MGIEADFLQLMPDSITLYPPISTDRYGKRTFSASGVTVRGHLQDADVVRTNQSGRTGSIIGVFYCYGIPACTTEYRMVIDGRDVEILKVDVANDENGPHHMAISYGDAATGGVGML